MISARFLELARDPQWWSTHFLFDGSDDLPWWWDPANEDGVNVLIFPVLDSHLELHVTSKSSDLSLVTPGSNPAQLGWDDEAHFHPHIFRWVELKAMADHIVSREPWNGHGELALALLHRFALGTTDEEVESMGAALTPVLTHLGLKERRRDEILSRYDWRPGRRMRSGDPDNRLVGPGWVPDERVGWRLDLWWSRDLAREGGDAVPAPYSLRRPENDEFPAAELTRILAGLMR